MANKIYVTPESEQTFTASGGTVVMTLDNLGTGAARQSAEVDRGSGAKAQRHRWRIKVQAGSSTTVGLTCSLYIGYGNGSIRDGALGASDAAVSSLEQLRNLEFVGMAQAHVTTSNTDFIASGEFEIRERYYVLVLVNNLGVSLRNSANVNQVLITPVPDEVQ